MGQRILIVGAGAGTVLRARKLGLHTVVMDGMTDAPALHTADCAEVADIGDPVEVLRVAVHHAVDAVFAAAESGLEAAALAARELGMAGPTQPAAFRLVNKLAQRQALAGHDVVQPAYRAVRSVSEAEAAARDSGTPVVVKPVDACGCRGVQQVDYPEDASLAFQNALRHTRSRTVLVEACVAGEELSVAGLMHEGRLRLPVVARRERSQPPYLHDVGMWLPAPLEDRVRVRLVQATEDALQAIGLHAGLALAEFILTEEGPCMIELSGCPDGGRLMDELVPRACGFDLLTDALRLALGEPPRETPAFAHGAAMCWLLAHSGVVVGVRGLEEARALPGVAEIAVGVQPGDVVGHAVDCAGRDRLGHVLAAGATAQAAIDAAWRARDTVEIMTRPVCEGAR